MSERRNDIARVFVVASRTFMNGIPVHDARRSYFVFDICMPRRRQNDRTRFVAPRTFEYLFAVAHACRRALDDRLAKIMSELVNGAVGIAVAASFTFMDGIPALGARRGNDRRGISMPFR